MVAWAPIAQKIKRNRLACVKWKTRKAKKEKAAVVFCRFEGYEGPIANAPTPIPGDAFLFRQAVEISFPAVEGYDGPLTEDMEVPDHAHHYQKELDPDVVVEGRQGFNGPVAEAPPRKEWPEDAVEWTAETPRKSAAADPELEADYTPRAERPAEWTQVGLMGQMLLRVIGDVEPGQFLAPSSDPGMAVAAAMAADGRPIVAMKVVEPMDADRGYAIVKAMVG